MLQKSLNVFCWLFRVTLEKVLRLCEKLKKKIYFFVNKIAIFSVILFFFEWKSETLEITRKPINIFLWLFRVFLEESLRGLYEN